MRFLLKNTSAKQKDEYFDEESLPPYVVVKRSKRARRMALRLDTKNRVMNLVIPPRQSLRNAYSFVDQHKDWIDAQIATLPTQIAFGHATILPILGRNIQIDVQYDAQRKNTHITIEGRRMIVRTNKTDPSARIERFLKNFAKQELTILAHEKAALIRKKIRSVRVADTRTRWGSCTHDGCLSFSWRLIFAPMESFDYVVAHEVAHLRHLDHGAKFWTLCEELSANYKKGKNWMRDHGKTLMRFG